MASLFRFSLFILSYLVALPFTYARDLPSSIKPCRRSEPNFHHCLINLIDDLKTNLTDGITEMKIQPLDPFHLPFVEFGPDSGLISVDTAIFENITVYGGTNFVLKNITVDFEAPKLSLDIDFPQTRVNCNYNISASTLFFPVSGDGLFSGNFTNISTHGVIYGEYYFENNQKQVRVTNQEISIDVENSEAYLEDTGNSLKNSLMNEFWPTIFGIIKPRAEVKVGEIAVAIFKDMLELYSVQDLAPY